MDSSESRHSNTVTDISHVLESLGSLIGELDAIEVDKGDAVDSSHDNYAFEHDLSLENLLADTDEFDDDDQRLLIPCKTSPTENKPSGFFSHGSHHNSHLNSNPSAQGHEGLACGPVYDIPTSGANSKAFSTSQFVSLESHNSTSLNAQEDSNHYSVPSGSRSKGVSSSQSGPLHLHNSTSLGTQGHGDHYSVPSGARSKGVSPSQSGPLHWHNSTSLKKHVHDTNSHYTVPPSRGGHKGAVKEVALSGEVHGSFKKLDEGSSTAAAQKCVHLPASHSKAEPNHYVTASEVGLPRPSQVDMKSDASRNSMVHSQQTIKERNSTQQVPVNVFNEDNKPIGLLVSSSMKAREACHKLALLNKVEDDPQWVLVEHLTDLGLERNLEDHENVMAILNTWAPGSNNKLLFRKDAKKYHFFAHTSNYFPPHLLDSENSDKAVTEKAQKAKTILHQKLFSTCTRVPEIEGILQCKEFGKKSWSKKFLFLRGSGIYSSNKGKSKASKDLECYVQFDGANLYNILINPKKSHKSPTEHCFCIVPFRARELKELKCFSVDDEKTLMSWKMAVRIAKFGPQLRQNYDDMLRKFAKLTKYHDQQTSESNRQNIVSEREQGSTSIKEGQVAMDFTGERGRVITDSKEIQELANTRNKAKLTHRISSDHFIPTGTAVPGHLFLSEPWYHGRITREQALALLITAGAHDGLFLVRESSSVAGVFVLTFCMNRRVYHCQLVQDIGEGTQYFFSLGKGPAFKTLHELIHFYQQKPLNGVSLALRTPCPKSACKS